MYISPIEIIQGQLEMKLERDVFKAIQRREILVDKGEPIRSKRLIDADDVLAKQTAVGICDAAGNHYGCADVVFVEDIIHTPTVDAVEVDDMRAFAKDVAYQFGYYCQYEGRLHITNGGLSTLEEAFEILGWKNPHPVPECECEIDGCHEHATCGAPTKDGYKRVCGKHFNELQKEA